MIDVLNSFASFDGRATISSTKVIWGEMTVTKV